ncbi:flippase [Sporolactobacillus nakayamae]|uniref:Polysaccharide biosynthesis C-terminal domain-containing protein n=1 Tax=Sporolactobacillus nakayamae TaxID=269670 RepID=A0A1I2W1H2_9BACL|nr:flippase [Sporolactobacillus nakayamae]SFG94437.1 Polysaccharide biosynthesis C-terminal domain-containing protein [Sporolactobacillus nakayamae]
MGDTKIKFFKNVSWLMGGQLINMVLQFIVSLATARYLGPSNYGTINYVSAYISFFSSVASLGLAVVVIKEISSGVEDENEIIWTSIFMRLTIAFLSAISVIGLMFVLNPNNKIIVLIAILQSLSILFSAFDTANYWFQAKLLSKYTSISSLVAYIGMSIYRIYLLAHNANILWFAFSFSVDCILLAALLMLFYIKKVGFHPIFSKKLCKSLLIQSYHYMIAGLITIIYSQMDRVLLGTMLNKNAVGLYSAALTITTLWGIIPTAFIQSASTILFKAANQNKILFMQRLKQVYAIILWLNIVYSIGVSIFAELIIRISFGKDYSAAESTLIIVVWYYGISCLSSVTQVYLSSEGKNKYINKFCIAGVIFNFILNWLLIPVYGILGSAIATLLTHILIQIVMPVFYKETREVGITIIKAIFLRDIFDEKLKKYIFSSFKKFKK